MAFLVSVVDILKALEVCVMKYTRDEILAHRAEWLAALRSGDYKQGVGCLRKGDEYCCLGVAVELSGEKPTGADSAGRAVYRGELSLLTKPAMDWLGVNYRNPVVGDRDDVAQLNDDGMSFSEIADLIETHGFRPIDDLLAQESRWVNVSW